MSIHTIYKIVNNINGKIYIGYDSNWPNRKQSHIYHIKDRNQYIYQALRKYGIENFTWESMKRTLQIKRITSEVEPTYYPTC